MPALEMNECTGFVFIAWEGTLGSVNPPWGVVLPIRLITASLGEFLQLI